MLLLCEGYISFKFLWKISVKELGSLINGQCRSNDSVGLRLWVPYFNASSGPPTSCVPRVCRRRVQLQRMHERQAQIYGLALRVPRRSPEAGCAMGAASAISVTSTATTKVSGFILQADGGPVEKGERGLARSVRDRRPLYATANLYLPALHLFNVRPQDRAVRRAQQRGGRAVRSAPGTPLDTRGSRSDLLAVTSALCLYSCGNFELTNSAAGVRTAADLSGRNREQCRRTRCRPSLLRDL
jgi:hypothetical protein